MELRLRRCPSCQKKRAELDGVMLCQKCELVALEGEIPLKLSGKMFKLLQLYLHRQGRIISTPEAIEELWGDDLVGGPIHPEKSLDVYHFRLKPVAEALGLRLENSFGRGWEIRK